MDQAVKGPILLLSALVLASAAAAQALPDPTRPPLALLAPAAEGAPPATAEPRLQSILISLRPHGRRVAVIDGQTVRVGGKVGAAHLVSIGAAQVVLKQGSELRTLKLFPDAAPGATSPSR